ncbi:hypothetical protein B0H13DRAFT_1156463 [Mycena leptocephala]|nr:hypothetical protein B0H13DRAFT_1156463 [Mycena leptocephala]
MQTVAEIVDAYAGTNEAPPDLDRLRINELVDEETTALGSLNAQILELRARYRELIMQRNRRKKRVRTLRAITSPLRVLPPEILSLIFMNCPRADAGTRAIRNPSPLLAPLLLVQICSRWRRVALDTPMLWTELQLVHPRNQLRDNIMLENWVSNASPLPISLSARCFYSDPLLHALTLIRRFKAVHLQLSWDSSEALASYSGCDAEILHIEIVGRTYFPAHYPAFRDSPSLRGFTLDTHGGSLLSFVLPWAQLTDLRVSEPLGFSSMTVLVQCTNLVNCTFGMMGHFIEGEDVAHHDHRTLPFLTFAHFTFWRLNETNTEEFLRPLVFPSLKTLIFDSKEERGWWLPEALADFQLRSGFELESLEIHGLSFGPEELTIVLECLPSLKSLTVIDVEGVASSVAVIHALTWNDSHSLLPQLELLKLGILQCDWPLRHLITMLKSRLDPRRVAVPGFSQLTWVSLESDIDTEALDRWWWEWKLPKAFPTLQWCFAVQGKDGP